MRNKTDSFLDKNVYSLPLRREVSSVLHFLHTQRGIIRSGLDIGFTNAGVSRILRQSGGYWMSVEPTAQRRDLVAAALGQETVLVSGAGGRYSESEVFQLLKDGFDVLGFRFTCRFWVQLVRQWVDRRREGGAYGMANGWLRFLYAAALFMDGLLVFTKGYQMTVYGHRKGWREKHAHVMSNATPVSDAMLSDPRREGKSISMTRFK